MIVSCWSPSSVVESTRQSSGLIGQTYTRASHLRNKYEQRGQMAKISCSDAFSQCIALAMHSAGRPKKRRSVPSIRKIFILTAYARAGEESQQRGVLACRKARWPCGIIVRRICLVRAEATARARSRCVVECIEVVRPSFNQ